MQSVTAIAPAKLNLALDITGFAPNGYHELDMIMQAVNLYETITVKKSNSLTLRLPNSTVPVNDFNTAIKAALEFFDYTGLLAGADITVRKAIPVRAGMAGGSADAAGVLAALNKLYGAHLTTEELCKIGVKVGADVPFAILGGTARVRGIGDIITPLQYTPACWFCVCMPPHGVSTKDAFAKYDTVGALHHPNCDEMQNALLHKNLFGLARQVYNVLEENSQSPYNASIRKILDENGALASAMTGSGAAVFGIFKSKINANCAKTALLQDYSEVWVLRSVERGVTLLN